MKQDFAASLPPMQNPRQLTSHKLRFSIGIQVVAIHCLVIFGPLGYVLYRSWLSPQESAFKVKLIGPLSTGEKVGLPSRMRPSPNPGTEATPTPAPQVPKPPPPAPQVPKKPAPPAPQVPKKPAKPAPQVPKKPAKPAPQVPKPAAQKKPDPKQPPRQSAQKKQETQQRPRKLSAAEQVALARQNAEKSGGGSNTNMAVPIGNADRAQTSGKQNNGSPGGGAKGEEERYWGRLGNYIKARWSEPPGSLLGDARPEVTIQLTIAEDGRVTDARIIKRSGNRSMDESVQRMLAQLERVPAPSNGRASIQMILRTQD